MDAMKWRNIIEAQGSAHLLCAADLGEAYAVAEQTDEGEFATSIVAEANQIRTTERWPDLTRTLSLIAPSLHVAGFEDEAPREGKALPWCHLLSHLTPAESPIVEYDHVCDTRSDR
jgi:hypothetical protein